MQHTKGKRFFEMSAVVFEFIPYKHTITYIQIFSLRKNIKALNTRARRYIA